MENQNQQSIQVPSSPNPVPALASKPKNKILIIVSAAIFLLLIAGGSYYLGTLNTRSRASNTIENINEQNNTVSKTPTVSETNTLSLTKLSSIPSDWTFKTSKTCKVDIPIPPAQAPYFTPINQGESAGKDDKGYTWQFEEYKAGMFMFTTTARAIYRYKDIGSGYVSGDVEVICSPNSFKYTTESLFAKLESDLKNGEITIKSKSRETKWEHNVNVIRFQGGMFEDSNHYLFATPNNIYLIRMIAMSKNQTVQDTTKQIFDNLQFSN